MIPLVKPKISDKEIKAVVKVLKTGQLAQGPVVAEFEKQVREYLGVKYALAVNNGTAALHCALFAAGVTVGDEVITSPFTFIATVNSILMQGAKPVFADIDESFNIDPKKVKEKITKKTKAIIAVDLYGNPSNYKELLKISKQHDIKLIADSAQAIGAIYGSKKVGNIADISTFSLYATKNIMSGEGGIVTTNDKKLADKVISFRNHGQNPVTRYEYIELGYNYRLTDVLAAIALEQFKNVDKITDKRINNAKKYNELLAGIKGLILPKIEKENRHAFHQYTIRLTEDFKGNRDAFTAFLKSEGIGFGIYYPVPLHLSSHLKYLGHKPGDFPITEAFANQVVSLPISQDLAASDLIKVAKVIKNYAKQT